MSPHALHIVVYDIGDERERSRLDRLLCGYGFRVQKSVFECRLQRSARKRMEAAISSLNLSSGHVLIYRSATPQRTAAIGNAPPAPPDADVAFVI